MRIVAFFVAFADEESDAISFVFKNDIKCSVDIYVLNCILLCWTFVYFFLVPYCEFILVRNILSSPECGSFL